MGKRGRWPGVNAGCAVDPRQLRTLGPVQVLRLRGRLNALVRYCNLWSAFQLGAHTGAFERDLIWLLDVERWLGRLPALPMTVVLLNHGCAYDQAEIARLLGCGARTVAKHYAEGLRILGGSN